MGKMMTTDKGKTNKKWTSSDEYRDNYDAIFSKKPKSEPMTTDTQKPELPVEKIDQ